MLTGDGDERLAAEAMRRERRWAACSRTRPAVGAAVREAPARQRNARTARSGCRCVAVAVDARPTAGDRLSQRHPL